MHVFTSLRLENICVCFENLERGFERIFLTTTLKTLSTPAVKGPSD